MAECLQNIVTFSSGNSSISKVLKYFQQKVKGYLIIVVGIQVDVLTTSLGLRCFEQLPPGRSCLVFIHMYREHIHTH